MSSESDRCEATADRSQATTDRAQATADRKQATVDRQTSRVDIAALAVEVGHLGASVQDLHNLILDSLVKSEQAMTQATAAPSRRKVYGLVAASSVLALALAGGGIVTARAMSQQARDSRAAVAAACGQRNITAAADAAFIMSLEVAAKRAAARGDVFAADVASLLDTRSRPVVVDCAALR